MIRMSLTANEIKRWQEERHKKFEELARTDPESARQLALRNLQCAGIVDEDGSLMAIYADGSERIAPLAFTRS